MNRYLCGLIEGLKSNEIEYEEVRPKGNGLKSKYFDYPLLALAKRNQQGKHLIISERYAYLLPFMGKENTVVCHDLHTLYQEAKTPFVHRVIYRVFLKFLTKATKIVCVSKHTKSDLEKFCPSLKGAKKLKVVHNGIEDFWVKNENISLPSEAWMNVFKNKKVLLSVGTDAWYKNNQWSLRLLAKLNSNFHLLRVGQWELANQQLIKELNIENRITLIQFIDDKELKFCYQNAEALLFPSLTEGYGWPALEAALCICPVISDGNGATQEIFKQRVGLINLTDAFGFFNLKVKTSPEFNYILWKDQVKRLTS